MSTWTPTDWGAVDRNNTIALLKVAAAGRRIYMVEENGDRFYRFDNIDSDWGDNIPDGSMWVEEITEMVHDGLLEQVGDWMPDAVITDAGRDYLAETTR
jgi:hypothetical protein